MKVILLLLAIGLFANAVVGRAVSKKEEKKDEEHHGQQEGEDVAVSEFFFLCEFPRHNFQLFSNTHTSN